MHLINAPVGVMLVEQDKQMVIAVLDHLAFESGSSSLLLLELDIRSMRQIGCRLGSRRAN
jgi:hypothetical protein